MEAAQRVVPSRDLTTKLGSYFAQQCDIVAVYVFGSFGTPRQHKFSDLDLGVVFAEGTPPRLGRELTLEAEVASLTGMDEVDLVNLNRAALQLRFRAIAEGELIYEGDAIALNRFLEHTYRLHGDYRYHMDHYFEEYRKALREAYLGDK